LKELLQVGRAALIRNRKKKKNQLDMQQVETLKTPKGGSVAEQLK